MTFPSELVLHKIFVSAKCPRCCQPKPQDRMFCEECCDKLPADLIRDLNEQDTYTRVVAYADATQYLMHEWR
jgi:predicted amidophosphoribosyltransferase